MICEREMYTPLEAYFRKKGIATYREVPVLTRRVDLIGVDCRGITAVELKVRNWQRALQQSLSYRLFAKRVYVALSKQFIHRIEPSIFRKYGIGILSVDGEVESILEPRESLLIHSSLVKSILRYIEASETKQHGMVGG